MNELTKTDRQITSLPLSIIDLDLTNNCILACDYCFRGAKNARRMSVETAKAALDWFISQSGNNKKLTVALFGGEPLMEFELIRQIVPYGQEQAIKAGKTMHFSATTNCVLIDDEKIAFFRKHKMTFHTSIDGGPKSQDKHRHFPDGSGTSAIIEPKIKQILKYWPTRTARMSVSNDTVQHWMEDVEYLTGLGYKHLAMIPIPELAWTEEQFDTMKKELRKISDFYIERYRQGKPIYIKHIDDGLKSIVKPQRRKSHCGAGRNYILVKTDGSIYPCHRFGGDVDAQSQQQWKLGTIYDGWDEAKRTELLNFDCRKHIKADCQNCLAVHMCGTTCIAVSWSCFKDIYQPHPNQCRFTNLYFAEAMRVHYILDSEGNKLFIEKFHPERLHKCKSNIQLRNGTSGESQTVFVMISSKSISPCFSFGDGNEQRENISLESVKKLMSNVSMSKSPVLELFFIADLTEKLDPAIASLLTKMPYRLIVPLITARQQAERMLPYSPKQTVIASDLGQLVLHKDSIRNRNVIVHINEDETDVLAQSLLQIAALITQITLRPKNFHQWTSERLKKYNNQLGLLKGKICITNFLNERTQCPAGTLSVTIGPDGNKYPCPAFYICKNLKNIDVKCDMPQALCPSCKFLNEFRKKLTMKESV